MRTRSTCYAVILFFVRATGAPHYVEIRQRPKPRQHRGGPLDSRIVAHEAVKSMPGIHDYWSSSASLAARAVASPPRSASQWQRDPYTRRGRRTLGAARCFAGRIHRGEVRRRGVSHISRRKVAVCASPGRCRKRPAGGRVARLRSLFARNPNVCTLIDRATGGLFMLLGARLGRIR